MDILKLRAEVTIWKLLLNRDYTLFVIGETGRTLQNAVDKVSSRRESETAAERRPHQSRGLITTAGWGSGRMGSVDGWLLK